MARASSSGPSEPWTPGPALRIGGSHARHPCPVAPLQKRARLLALRPSALRGYFPKLCSKGQLNRRIRALEPELRALHQAFAEELSEPRTLYRVVDTTLIPAIVRVRACRKGLFAGQATF